MTAGPHFSVGKVVYCPNFFKLQVGTATCLNNLCTITCPEIILYITLLLSKLLGDKPKGIGVKKNSMLTLIFIVHGA